MTVFSSTLNQTAFLFCFIISGWALAKIGVLQPNSVKVLSKLENWLFIPALVMGSFIENFTISRIGEMWKLMAISVAIELVAIPIAIMLPKLLTKDTYLQKISTYGLAISNWGFMGNAVMLGLYPEIFFEYIIFTLPLWIVNFLWAMPALLMPISAKPTLKDKLKNLVNPMFCGMVIGMIIGLLQIPVPAFLLNAVNTAGSCMSPMAMLLTGVAVSAINLKETFSDAKIYIISLLRLIAIPVAFSAVLSFLPLSEIAYICAVVSISMPLGMNIVVIPASYGQEKPICSGLVIVSHLLSCITLPLLFSIFL
ncbi:MAG: AEC family transporter [Oscillospiraceae bacterium]|nr:AEC family transporter [Oscillospiraceae bacterium]